MQEVRAITRQFKGLNLLVPPETLPPEMFLVDQNGDRRRGMSWRVRPGYRRLYTGLSEYVPTQEFTEDFEGISNGTLFSALGDWTELEAGGTSNLFVSIDYGAGSTKVVDGGGSTSPTAYGLAVWSGNDQYAQCRGGPSHSGHTVNGFGAGIGVRLTVNSGYVLEFTCTNSSGDHTVKVKRVNSADDWSGSMTTLHTTGTYTYDASRLYEIRIVGSTLSLRVNGTEVWSTTDTANTTGVPGIWANLEPFGSIQIGEFHAGTLAAETTAVKANDAPRHLLAFERDDNEAQLVVSSPGRVEAFETGTPEGV